jgi:hypothetical protein
MAGSPSRARGSRPSAAYSGTPLPKKLGINEDSRLALVGAPDGFEQQLADLPANVEIRRDLRTHPDMALFFSTSLRAYERALPRVASVLERGGGVWIAWPKKASGLATDLDENVIRDRALARGLVDIKVCAIDATWSGLRIARRRVTS